LWLLVVAEGQVVQTILVWAVAVLAVLEQAHYL
jgi:hypothetical protein